MEYTDGEKRLIARYGKCQVCGGARTALSIGDQQQLVCTRLKEHPREEEDTSPDLEREAAGYQYRDSSFQIIHTTSVPMTDQEALEYCSIVDAWFLDVSPMYVEVRRLDSGHYKMLPYVYDAETREVAPLEA